MELSHIPGFAPFAPEKGIVGGSTLNEAHHEQGLDGPVPLKENEATLDGEVPRTVILSPKPDGTIVGLEQIR